MTTTIETADPFTLDLYDEVKAGEHTVHRATLTIRPEGPRARSCSPTSS